MTDLHVAVGVVLDAERRVLLSRRAEGAHQGGLWEFPGGKRFSRLHLAAALARELHEELDIAVGRSSALLSVHHDYGDKRVLLDVHVVWEFSGEPRPVEGQPLAWVAAAALGDYEFPAANRAIVRAVQALLAG